MTSEQLLDAIGLLDDDLIREAEEYKALRKRPDYRRWGSLAACCALVLALGYGALWLGTGGDPKKGLAWDGASGGGNTTAPAGSAPAASDHPWVGDFSNGAEIPAQGETEPDSPMDSLPGEAAGGAAGGANIRVDGTLYRSTGRTVPTHPNPDTVKTVVSYTSGTPEMDGQTNFSQDLSAQYAMTDLGLLILVDEAWILFEPVP